MYRDGKYLGEMHNSTYIDDSAKGYIYCYDKTKFIETEKNSAQFVSYQPLKPERIVEVYYKDFKDLFVNVEKQVSL